MGTLPTIDVQDIIEDLEIETKARDQARKDQPDRTRADMDFVEHQIVDHINDLKNQGRTIAEQTVLDLQKRYVEVDLEGCLREIRDLPDFIRLQVDRELANHRDELVALRKSERVRLAELKAFEDEHKLKDRAEYPTSNLLHWSIVFAMVLTESIANSYFFAKGSGLGLVGGILQAMLISVVNIGAGLLAGHYPMRFIHHKVDLLRYASWIALVLYTCFVFAFNLATAHYRALLELDPLTALSRVFFSLRKGPFSFDNFDAVILLSIGVIFALLALIKSYRSDTFYPHHGKMDRRHKEAEELYQDAKEEARRITYNVLDDGAGMADDFTIKARRSAFEQPAVLEQLDQFTESFNRFNGELQTALVTLLKTYRDRNEKIRPSPPPAYFKVYPVLEIDESLPVERFNTNRTKSADTTAILKEIEAEVAKFGANLRALNTEITNDFNKFIEKIEDVAEEEAREFDEDD